MDWLTDIVPYIMWIIVIVVLFLPSSRGKKIKELEHRIEELERKVNLSK